MKLNNQAKFTYKVVFPDGRTREDSDVSNIVITQISNREPVPHTPIYFPRNLNFNMPERPVETNNDTYLYLLLWWIINAI